MEQQEPPSGEACIQHSTLNIQHSTLNIQHSTFAFPESSINLAKYDIDRPNQRELRLNVE